MAARGAIKLLQQLVSSDPQSLRQSFEDDDRRVAHATLDAADIGPVQLSLEGERLLRQAFLQPEPFHIEPNAASHVHASTVAGVSPIDLQTMSLISLDCAAKSSNVGTTPRLFRRRRRRQ